MWANGEEGAASSPMGYCRPRAFGKGAGTTLWWQKPQLLPNELLPYHPASCRHSQKIAIYIWGIPQGQFAPPKTCRPVIPACIHWISTPASPSAKLSTDLQQCPTCMYPFSRSTQELVALAVFLCWPFKPSAPFYRHFQDSRGVETVHHTGYR